MNFSDRIAMLLQAKHRDFGCGYVVRVGEFPHQYAAVTPANFWALGMGYGARYKCVSSMALAERLSAMLNAGSLPHKWVDEQSADQRIYWARRRARGLSAPPLRHAA